MASTTSGPAIEATDLRKTYASAVALDGVSLSIPAGTVYGFLGPNGAGKTTTMRLLTGLSRPDAGHVRVCGVDVADRRALASHVGYLPETPPLYEEFSGREQLEYVADLRDLPGDVAAERIDRYLEQFDLVADADKRISAYSKGMKQKTAFIQAVLHDPDVLFLDEPTGGLDPRAARRMRESMVDFADGRVVAEGPTDSIRARAEGDGGSLEDAFLAVTGGRGDATPEDPVEGETGSTESTARR